MLLLGQQLANVCFLSLLYLRVFGCVSPSGAHRRLRGPLLPRHRLSSRQTQASKRAKTRRHKGTKPTSSGSSRHPPALPPNTPDKHVVGGRPAHMLQGHMSVANAAGSPATAFFSPYSVEPNSALSSGESVRMEALTAGDSVPRLQPTTNAFSSIWPPWDLEYLSAAPTARIMSTAHLGRDQRSRCAAFESNAERTSRKRYMIADF